MRVSHLRWRTPCVVLAATLALWAAPHGAWAVCGDAVVDSGEDCDDGGTCPSGDHAGARCPASVTDGVDCGADIVCKPAGGDGCAANCTTETRRTFAYAPGTTFSRIQGAALGLTFPILGSQVLTTSSHPDANGNYAVVIKADDVHIQPIKVGSPGNLCACVRGQAVKTCGGGPTGRQCTFDQHICDGKNEGPCLFIHGPGNSASGKIGCGVNGLSPIDVDLTQDHNIRFSDPSADCTGPGQIEDHVDEGACNGAVQVTTSGDGPAGSALLLNSLNIQTLPDGGSCNAEPKIRVCKGGSANKADCTNNPAVCVGGECITNPAVTSICIHGVNPGDKCTGNPAACDGGECVPAKGLDGIACTDDDPITALTATVPLTTGLASSSVLDVNNSEGIILGPGQECPVGNDPPTLCLASQQGAPFSCDALAANPTGGTGGAKFGSAFPALHNVIGDLIVSTSLAAPVEQPVNTATPTPTSTTAPTTTPTTPTTGTCVGDCGNDGAVTVEELIRGVNIALGVAPLSDCPQFDADHSTDVTVEELIQGVNIALTHCPAA
ncbi:MAG: hypothetical protein HYR72_08605 [Deltaproteobacteria bacterium]|nr:hypothetical protein [Deltaproteobacteria bacterium]MBI3388814.1 hypothetical protein [Deltaproteobacteria bacterium]